MKKRKPKARGGAAVAPPPAPPPPAPKPPPFDPGPIHVTYPDAAEVPDWSERTIKLFEPLSVLERAFVEWIATGCSAAEAYRRAAGSDSEFAKQSAYYLRHRPTVAAAIQAALRDRNVGARCDREWKLARLRAGIVKCEASEHPGAVATMGRLVKTMAEIQGEIGQPAGGTDGGAQRVNVSIRIDSILAGVAALIAERTGRPTPAVGWSNQGPDAGGGDDAVDSQHGAAGPGVPKSC